MQLIPQLWKLGIPLVVLDHARKLLEFKDQEPCYTQLWKIWNKIKKHFRDLVMKANEKWNVSLKGGGKDGIASTTVSIIFPKLLVPLVQGFQ